MAGSRRRFLLLKTTRKQASSLWSPSQRTAIGLTTPRTNPTSIRCCVSDPHHTCRYGSFPVAHRLVVPVLSFPSDREPSLSRRSRLASFYTRTDQLQPIDAIGPDFRCA